MSDDFMELDNDLDAVEAARQSAPIGNREQDRQPINLDDIPEFKDYQASENRRYEQLRQQNLRNEKRAQDIETELHQIRMQGMDATQQLQYELDWTRKQWQDERSLREQERYAIQRQRDLEDIHVATGISMQELMNVDASVPVHDIWRVATKISNEAAQQKQKAAPPPPIFDEPVPNDTVDVAPNRGGSSSTSRLQEYYDKYRKSYDFDKVMEVMAVAAQRNIPLREW